MIDACRVLASLVIMDSLQYIAGACMKAFLESVLGISQAAFARTITKNLTTIG